MYQLFICIFFLMYPASSNTLESVNTLYHGASFPFSFVHTFPSFEKPQTSQAILFKDPETSSSEPLLFPSPGDLPNPANESTSPGAASLQAGSLTAEPLRKPTIAQS